MRRKQVEGALQSTQKDGMLTVDQALVKQAWERASNRVRAAGEYKPPQKFPARTEPRMSLLHVFYRVVIVVPWTVHSQSTHSVPLIVSSTPYFSSWTGTCSWTGLCQLLWIRWGRGCMRRRELCDKRSSSIRRRTWQLPLSTGLWSSTRLACRHRQRPNATQTNDGFPVHFIFYVHSCEQDTTSF